MKRLIGLLLFCCLFAYINAQTAKEEIFSNLQKSGANYYAYPEAVGKKTPPPAGYRPFYLSHYGRHGSRYQIDPEDYSFPLQTLQRADSFHLLTSKGREVLAIVDSVSRMAQGRLGELTWLGAQQHRGIADRMYHNYPEIFQGKAEIDARSTIIIRCILSMNAECMQLQSLNSQLRIRTDASRHDMYYMNYSDAHFDSLRSVANKQALTFGKRYIHPERLTSTLFNNPDYVKWNVDADKLMVSLFKIAGNMQSLETGLNLFPYFTKEECYDLWKAGNIWWYLTYGPSPITKGEQPYAEANLLKNILDTADKALLKKESSATLRFGHEVCVLPLACLLELGNCNYQTTDWEHLDKVWRNYDIFPMGCNIQFIFYKKKGSNDTLVKVLLNEAEQQLPVKSDVAPYYHWKDVESYYRHKLTRYTGKKNY